MSWKNAASLGSLSFYAAMSALIYAVRNTGGMDTINPRTCELTRINDIIHLFCFRKPEYLLKYIHRLFVAIGRYIMKRVVIVDDELPSRELFANLICKYRFPLEIVGVASSGVQAVQMISELRPNIVFLDIQMPVKNGLEVMNELRALSQGNQQHAVKIIVITAYSEFEYVRTALRLGAKDYLLKPIDYRQLCDAMQRVLGYWYTDNPAFNELLEYIDANYEKSLNLQDYADYIHMSPGYVTRLFNKYLDMGFKEWINEVRIRKAMELLETTDLSIKSISDKVGYNNLNYFYRKFNSVTGTTPKNYRL